LTLRSLVSQSLGLLAFDRCSFLGLYAKEIELIVTQTVSGDVVFLVVLVLEAKAGAMAGWGLRPGVTVEIEQAGGA
jgi:hypothetical protein